MMSRVSMVCIAGMLASCPPAAAQEFVNLLDHLSLAAPDQPKAVAWYKKHFGGEPMTEGPDRLTIECKPLDHVRWVLIRHLNGERESAAGETMLLRLLEVLAPYEPQRWFRNAPHQATAGAPHRP